MKNKGNWLGIIFTMLILTTCSMTVHAAETDGEGDTTLAPYFLIEGTEASADSFPLKKTEVVTNINGVIAETFVTQTYTNEGEIPINASYVFPASTRVTVHGMTMQIGNEVITAKIKEKQEAKQEYEQAKSEGKSASLLEEQRPNVFTMDVANVMPGDTIRIELHYTELIVPSEGTYQFVFPTVAGPRYSSPHVPKTMETDGWIASPFLKAGEEPSERYNITVNLSAGVPISELTCSSHAVDVAWTGDTAAQVTLSNPAEFAGDRDFILDYKLTGNQVNCGLTLGKGEKENFFMLMVQPPERYQTEDITPREYIFVLDVSGSMYGYPLDTAKKLIRDLVTNLRETDRFNLILFSGASLQMSPVSVPATVENIGKATALIDAQEGGGGTELVPALENALAIPAEKEVSRSIVVITDGYIAEEKEIFDLINKNAGAASFFSFGIGSSVNRYLIDGIAQTGMGDAFVVTDDQKAAETAEKFRTYIQYPLLTDIRVDYEGFDVYEVEPSVLSTLFAQRPIVLFGKWRGEPAGTIRITGKSGSRDYVQEIQVSDAEPLEENNIIRYLWARKKVERLTDYGFSEDLKGAAKKEVTQIGLDYSMITPYTSFIAVTETIRNESGESTDVKQPIPLPRQVSDLAIGGYTVGSEPGFMLLLAFAAAAAGINVYSRNRRRRTAGRDD